MLDGTISDLERQFREFDLTHLDWGVSKYQIYAYQMSNDPSFRKMLLDLLISDIKFRKEHGLNFVASTDGFQGRGKSLFNISLCKILASIFGEPFQIQHIAFSSIELDRKLKNSKPRETFLRDEQSESQHGEMANMINENLTDYENQLRITQNNLLFANVKMKTHSHFFQFEAIETKFNNQNPPFPLATRALLQTPLFTNKNIFVARGIIELPAPSKEFLAEYDQAKREYIQNTLKNKAENTFNFITAYTQKVLEKAEKDLIYPQPTGLIRIASDEEIYTKTLEIIGSGKFTIKGYKHLCVNIKKELRKKYEEHNAKALEELQKKKQEEKKGKEEIFKQKMDLEKEKLELKKARMREAGII